jgi:excisionase family DNA binding protein
MTTTKNILTAPDSQRDRVGGRKFSKARSVAERLGICPRTIFRWADAGKITRHKINARVVLFDESEVTAFIESARVTSYGVTEVTSSSDPVSAYK